MSLEHYSAGKLTNILCKSISEFKILLKKDETIGSNMKSFLPSPHNFRYLHEFKEYEYTKGGILVVGLNPHLGKEKTGAESQSNNHTSEDGIDEEWKKKYKIENARNTSDFLLKNYSYFKLFAGPAASSEENKAKYQMNLIGIDPNVKFTDVILIRTESRNKLRKHLDNGTGKKDDEVLREAVEVGWNSYLSEILKLINPRVMVCNSADLSKFLEGNFPSSDGNIQTDTINIELEEVNVPCVLSGQITGQRATDKWTLIRLKDSIMNAIRK